MPRGVRNTNIFVYTNLHGVQLLLQVHVIENVGVPVFHARSEKLSEGKRHVLVKRPLGCPHKACVSLEVEGARINNAIAAYEGLPCPSPLGLVAEIN